MNELNQSMAADFSDKASECGGAVDDGLSALRAEIDSIDGELAALVERRMAVSEKVAAAKAKNGAPLFVPAREAEVVRRAQGRVSECNRDAIAEIMAKVMGCSRARQLELREGGTHPLHSLRREFRVRMSELDAEGRVRPSAVCGYLQEVASSHAAQLGVGMPLLAETAHTWMLSRLTVDFLDWPKWDETISVRTWPSGVRGRLLALRDFIVHGADGRVLAVANSEWLFIDISSGRISKLTPEIVALAPEGTPRAPVEPGEPPDPKAPLGDGERTSVEIAVRNADADVNRHANHLRLIDWVFESSRCAGRPRRLDIVFRQGAMPGDRVKCESVCSAEGLESHRLTRVGDDSTLAVALVRN